MDLFILPYFVRHQLSGGAAHSKGFDIDDFIQQFQTDAFVSFLMLHTCAPSCRLSGRHPACGAASQYLCPNIIRHICNQSRRGHKDGAGSAGSCDGKHHYEHLCPSLQRQVNERGGTVEWYVFTCHVTDLWQFAPKTIQRPRFTPRQTIRSGQRKPRTRQ